MVSVIKWAKTFKVNDSKPDEKFAKQVVMVLHRYKDLLSGGDIIISRGLNYDDVMKDQFTLLIRLKCKIED